MTTDGTEAAETTPESQLDGELAGLGGQVDGTQSAAEAGGTANPPGEPNASATGPEFVPEQWRAEARNWNPEFQEWVKSGTMMQADYQRKTQEVAQQRAELKAQGEYAALGQSIANDPELHALVAAKRAGLELAQPTQQDTTEKKSLLDMSEDELSAEIDRRAELAAERKLQGSDVVKMRKIDQGLSAHFQSQWQGKATLDQYKAAYATMTRQIAGLGKKVTDYSDAELAVFIDPHVTVQLATSSAASKQPPAPAARAASLPTPGATGVLKVPKPYENAQGETVRAPTADEFWKHEGAALEAELLSLAKDAEG